MTDVATFKSVDATASLPYSAIHLVAKFPQISPVDDPVSMTFNYFASGVAPALADVVNLVTQWIAKFNSIQGTAASPACGHMANTVMTSGGACSVEAYDLTGHLDGSPHGSPVNVQTFNPSGIGGNGAMPGGCAIAISIRAPYGSDVEFAPGARPRSRDRGRIYFGPVDNQAIQLEATTNRATVKAATRNDLLQWIHGIATITTVAGTIWELGVWSRAAQIIKQIIEAQIDDRFDYQRRRSDQGTTLSSIPIP